MGARDLKDVSAHMDKSVEAIRHELGTVRTGKASPSLLDLVKVEAYGQQMPLNQMATISAPEPRRASSEVRSAGSKGAHPAASSATSPSKRKPFSSNKKARKPPKELVEPTTCPRSLIAYASPGPRSITRRPT